MSIAHAIALQWGRGSNAPESQQFEDLEDFATVLQWGRGSNAPERAAYESYTRYAQELQWGRGSNAPESGPSLSSGIMRSLASMRPGQ